MHRRIVLLLVVVAASCAEPPNAEPQCQSNADCGEGLVCLSGSCTTQEAPAEGEGEGEGGEGEGEPNLTPRIVSQRVFLGSPTLRGNTLRAASHIAVVSDVKMTSASFRVTSRQ